jgi:hypothetical protein
MTRELDLDRPWEDAATHHPATISVIEQTCGQTPGRSGEPFGFSRALDPKPRRDAFWTDREWWRVVG